MVKLPYTGFENPEDEKKETAPISEQFFVFEKGIRRYR